MNEPQRRYIFLFFLKKIQIWNPKQLTMDHGKVSMGRWNIWSEFPSYLRCLTPRSFPPPQMANWLTAQVRKSMEALVRRTPVKQRCRRCRGLLLALLHRARFLPRWSRAARNFGHCRKLLDASIEVCSDPVCARGWSLEGGRRMKWRGGGKQERAQL